MSRYAIFSLMALVVLLVGASVVFAQESGVTIPGQMMQGTPGQVIQGAPGNWEVMQERHDAMREYLPAEVQPLHDAMGQAMQSGDVQQMQDAMNEAFENGGMQQMHDAMTQAYENGDLPATPGMGGGYGPGGYGPGGTSQTPADGTPTETQPVNPPASAGPGSMTQSGGGGMMRT